MLFTRIVVPLDGSELAEKALPYAEELARLASIPLHLVRVVDVARIEQYTAIAVEYAALDLLLVEERDGAAAYLADMKRRIEERGVAVTAEPREGSAAREIIAATRPGDVLAMATHGRGGLARWFLGSIAEDVARRSPVPVLLVRAEASS